MQAFARRQRQGKAVAAAGGDRAIFGIEHGGNGMVERGRNGLFAFVYAENDVSAVFSHS